jgi:YVTN family beta-propeller protein
VWVTGAWGVSRVDPVTLRVVARVRLPFAPVALAADATGVWLANGTANTVWQIDPGTNRVARRIRVGREPAGIALGFGSVWTANRMDGTISRIDAATGRLAATIAVGGRPTAVAAGDGGVWAATHALPRRTLSEQQYATELRRVHEHAYFLSFLIKQAIWPGSRDSVTPVQRKLGRAVTGQIRIVNSRLREELGELAPPPSEAAALRRYRADLIRMGAAYRALGDAYASGDPGARSAASGDIAGAWLSIFTELPKPIRAAVPTWALAGILITPWSRASR